MAVVVADPGNRGLGITWGDTMTLPHETRVRKVIKRYLANELAQSNSLLAFGIGLPNPQVFSRCHVRADTLAILIGLYTKACLSYTSVIRLCESGLDRSAAPINRSLIETLLNFTFLIRRRVSLYRFNNGTKTPLDLFGKKLDLEFRTALYCAYCLLRDESMVSKWAMTPGLARTMQVQPNLSTAPQQQPHIDKLGNDWKKRLGKNPMTCVGLPVWEFAASLGKPFPVLYRLLYAMDSQSVHQSDALNYLEADDELRSFGPKWHTSPSHVRKVLLQGSMVFLGCVGELSRRFRFGTEVRRRYAELAREWKTWRVQ